MGRVNRWKENYSGVLAIIKSFVYVELRTWE